MTHCSSIASLFFLVDKTKLKGISDSGHGGQTPDLDGDEDDGFDEGMYWHFDSLEFYSWPP